MQTAQRGAGAQMQQGAAAGTAPGTAPGQTPGNLLAQNRLIQTQKALLGIIFRQRRGMSAEELESVVVVPMRLAEMLMEPEQQRGGLTLERVQQETHATYRRVQSTQRNVVEQLYEHLVSMSELIRRNPDAFTRTLTRAAELDAQSPLDLDIPMNLSDF